MSCSLVMPSSSRCCSASLKMPSLSGTLGAGLTGKASGKCFCNGQIAATAGSCSRGFAWGGDLRLGGFGLSAFSCTFSARRRSRSSASCSKPIVQFTASKLIARHKDKPCSATDQLKQMNCPNFPGQGVSVSPDFRPAAHRYLARLSIKSLHLVSLIRKAANKYSHASKAAVVRIHRPFCV
ncbi:hypothetical protein D3C79_834830 [compost metagenome]